MVFFSFLNCLGSFSSLHTDTSARSEGKLAETTVSLLPSYPIVTSSGMMMTLKLKWSWEQRDNLWQRGGGCANNVRSLFPGWRVESHVYINCKTESLQQGCIKSCLADLILPTLGLSLRKPHFCFCINWKGVLVSLEYTWYLLNSLSDEHEATKMSSQSICLQHIAE